MVCLGWIVSGGVEHAAPEPWTWPAAQRWQTASWPREPWLLMTVLDVGQGDATVLRFPSGRTWLVDAGGSLGETFDFGARVTSPALWALGHRQLARVIVTHAHPDHAAGVPAVLRRFGPRELVTGIAVAGDQLGARLSATARGLAIAERRVSSADAFADGPVRVDVMHPEQPDWERRRVRNDDSLVLWVRFGDVGILLPGDVGQQVEIEVARRIAAAPLTVLKLAHHGSSSSTSVVLLQQLRPALALVSAGRANRFGHPTDDVVRRVEGAPATLVRTDRAGAIQLATNGRVLLVRTAGGLEGSLTARPIRRAWWLATPPPSDRAWPRRVAAPRPRVATPPT
jgi:competence protein ComEC